jgi:hypothetical protein
LKVARDVANNPAFLAANPDGRNLTVLCELPQGSLADLQNCGGLLRRQAQRD